MSDLKISKDQRKKASAILQIRVKGDQAGPEIQGEVTSPSWNFRKMFASKSLLTRMGCLYSWTGGRDQWMDVWIDGWIGGWRVMERLVDRWMDGWMDG